MPARGVALLDPTRLLTDALVGRLAASYHGTYGSQDSTVPEIAAWASGLAMENISRSDATYHDTEHTAMVVLCGSELLRCLHLVRGGVSTDDWLHFILALLCHDIGYVRGVCRGDQPGGWLTGVGDDRIELPVGATDASLQPWHVDRGVRFVRERFAGHARIDVERIVACIDYTRFPVPQDPAYHETGTYRALARAADLIGQLADPFYLRKLPALYFEMRENGQDTVQGFRNPTDLRVNYPVFYEAQVRPWVDEAISLLRVTAEGRKWVATLFAHVQQAQRFGPEGAI